MMLSPEQLKSFQGQLMQDDGQSETTDESTDLSPEQQQQALAQGAEMAKADAQGGQPAAVAPQPETQPAQPAPNPGEDLIKSLGFGSVEELANAFKEASASQAEMKKMLATIAALDKAQGTEEELDPNDPDARMKSIIRDELKPLRDKAKQDARNLGVQDAWKKYAATRNDLPTHMADIQKFIMEHPSLSTSDDGLERAHDAVLARKYKSESDMLQDPEFVKKAASNEAIRKAVLAEHLNQVSKSGDAVPDGIDNSGSTPLTSTKKIQKNSIKAASDRLRGML